MGLKGGAGGRGAADSGRRRYHSLKPNQTHQLIRAKPEEPIQGASKHFARPTLPASRVAAHHFWPREGGEKQLQLTIHFAAAAAAAAGNALSPSELPVTVQMNLSSF